MSFVLLVQLYLYLWTCNTRLLPINATKAYHISFIVGVHTSILRCANKYS